MSTKTLILATIAAAVLGFGVGTSGSGEAAPAPKAKTVTETVEVIPEACTEALAAADVLIDLAAEGMGVAADGFFAASNFDVAGITEVTAKLDVLTPQVTAARADYDAATAECTASTT
jgi:ribosomal protein S5